MYEKQGGLWEAVKGGYGREIGNSSLAQILILAGEGLKQELKAHFAFEAGFYKLRVFNGAWLRRTLQATL